MKNNNKYLNLLDQMKELIDMQVSENSSGFTDEVVALESWLLEQIQKIRMLKINESLMETFMSGNSYQGESTVLIFDEHLQIISYKGAFSYFVGREFEKSPQLSFLNFIDRKDQADRLVDLINFAKEHQECYSFNVALKGVNGFVHDLILEIKPYREKLFQAEISYVSFSKSYFNPGLDYQSFLLQNIPGVAIYLYDCNFRFLMVGGKEKECCGLKESEIVGKTLFDVFDQSMAGKLYTFFYKSIHGNADEGFVRFQGQPCQVNSFPIKDNGGNVIAGVAVINRSIVSHYKSMYPMIEKRGDEEESFIANFTHEFRTSLIGILGFTELLQLSDLDEKQARFNFLIHETSDQLLHLVDEVMNMSKQDEKKLKSENLIFNIHELFGELSEQFLAEAMEKKIDFQMNIEFDQPINFCGDLYRVKQILLNLLINAFKFTKKGMVSLSCSLVHENYEEAMLKFTVVDTGVGISEDELPFVFQASKQAHSGSVNANYNIGVGLAISERLVGLLEGDIHVQSKLNEGTKFIVNLPFLIAH